MRNLNDWAHRATGAGLVLVVVVAGCSPGASSSDQAVTVAAEVEGADNPLDISALGIILFDGQHSCPADTSAFDASGHPIPPVASVASTVVGIRPDLVANPGGGTSRLSDEAFFGHLPVGDYTMCTYVLDGDHKVIPECTIGRGGGHLAGRTKLPLQSNNVCYPPGTQGVNGSGGISYAPYFDLTRILETTCAGGKASVLGQVVSLDHDPNLFWRVSKVLVAPPGGTVSWSVPNITDWQPAPGGAVEFSASLDVPGVVSFQIDTKDSKNEGLSFSLEFVFYQSGLVTFIVPQPGVQSSIWSDGSVSLAIPLQNVSEAVGVDVHLVKLDVPSATRLAPTLPEALGDVLPDDIKKIDARFNVPTFGVPYEVEIEGTYAAGESTCNFHALGVFVPQQSDSNPVRAVSGNLDKVDLRTAVFPPFPAPPPAEREFNGTGLLPPLGEPRLSQVFQNPPGGNVPGHSLLRRVNFPINPPPPPLQFDCPDSDPGEKVFFTRNTVGATFGGFPPDPSVAGNWASTCASPPCTLDDVTMFTANTAVFYSTDSGLTFTPVNLFTLFDPAIPGRNSFFPQDDGGLCCDQVVTYVPNGNIFVWLLQYWPRQTGTDAQGNPITGPSRLRIAWASPDAIRSDFLHAWTWVDLTSAGLSLGNDWMDYPDLGYSDSFVYVGVDHGIANSGQVFTARHIYARLSLADILDANKSSVGYQYMDPTRSGLWQNHIVQPSPDALYFTAMPDTSTFTVYSWPDSSNVATPHDIKISNFSNADYSAPTPEGIDWNAAPKMILGATRTAPFCFGCSDRFLYFAFSAGRSGSGRPFPYVRVEKVNLDTFSLVSELDIWNPDFAYAMPALVYRPNNTSDEVALSLAVGGGGNFADNAVGFLGDFVVYVTTDSNTTHAGYNRDKKNNIIRDGNGNPTYSVRFGDYYSARNSIGPVTKNGRGVGYSTLGYAARTAVAGKKCVDVGCSIPEHYIQFGRFAELCPQPPPPPPR